MKENGIRKSSVAWVIVTVIEILRVQHVHNCGDAFNMIFWKIEFLNNNQFLQSIILVLLPQTLILFFWGDYFEEMVYRNASLLLTRKKNIFMILRKFYCKLTVKIIICLIAWVTVVCLFCVFKGCFLLSIEDIVNIILYIVYTIQLLEFVNMLSVIDTSIIGTLVGISMQITGLTLIKIMFNRNVEKMAWIPSYAFVLCNKAGMIPEKIVEILYLVVLSGLFFIVNCQVMKRREWI